MDSSLRWCQPPCIKKKNQKENGHHMIPRKLKPHADSSMLNMEDSLVYLRQVKAFSQPSNEEFVHSSHLRDNSYTLYTIHRSFCQFRCIGNMLTNTSIL
ncbi:hypothetical protein NC652_030984 [Populus alba x Populus x berolinensis]|nr:hypothetical protein NC652_030984 [Populus alba x Populus x berolinensis]